MDIDTPFEEEWVEETYHDKGAIYDEEEYYEDYEEDEFYEEETEEPEDGEYYEEVPYVSDDEELGSSAFMSEDFDLEDLMKEEEKPEVEMQPFELTLFPSDEVSSLEDASESSFVIEEMVVPESRIAKDVAAQHKFEASGDWEDEDFEDMEDDASFDYDEVVDAASDDDGAYTEEEILEDETDDDDDDEEMEVTNEESADEANVVSDDDDDEEAEPEDDPMDEEEKDVATTTTADETKATNDEGVTKEAGSKEKAKDSKGKSKKSKKKKAKGSKTDVIVEPDEDVEMEKEKETEKETEKEKAPKKSSKSKSSKSKEKHESKPKEKSEPETKEKPSKSKDKSSKKSKDKESSKTKEKSKKHAKPSKEEASSEGEAVISPIPATEEESTKIEASPPTKDAVKSKKSSKSSKKADKAKSKSSKSNKKKSTKDAGEPPSLTEDKSKDSMDDEEEAETTPLESKSDAGEDAADSGEADFWDEPSESQREEGDLESKKEPQTTKIEQDKSPVAEEEEEDEEEEEYFTLPGGYFWGRAKEMKGLDAALSAIDKPNVANVPRVAWIHGNAGVGKTALAKEFLRINDDACLTCYGCFEEKMDSTKPFSAIVDCLSELVRQIQADETVQDWKGKITSCLGTEAQLLASLIPGLATMLEMDSQLKVTEFDMTTRRLYDRLRFVVRRFIYMVCQYHRVIMVLDDMQWGGQDALKLIETFLSISGIRNFFFIGSHRGIKKTHGLQRMKGVLQPVCSANIGLEYVDKKESEKIVLGYLNMITPTEMDDNIKDLSRVLFSKCEGNPLPLVESILFLCRKKLLTPGESGWTWDEDSILDETAAANNSMGIVEERLKLLDANNLLVLKAAGLLGLRTFRVNPLLQAVKACFRAEKKTKTDVCPVTSTEEVEAILDDLSAEFMIEKVSTTRYKFNHDTIRKAAVSLLPNAKNKRTLLHLNLATGLTSLRVTSSYDKKPLEKEELKFLLVEHYGMALDHLRSEKEKEMFAKLSLELAEAAMTKAAFLSAARKLQTGLSVLDEESRWETNYSLTLKIHLTLARIKFCLGALGESVNLCTEITVNARMERDKLDTYELIIFLYQAKGDLDGAYNATVNALIDIFDADLEESLEVAVARVRGLLDGKTNADLQALPTMTHKKAASKLRFLSHMAEICSLRRDYPHQDMAALRMVEFTLLYGSSSFTALSFSLYGLCLIRRGLFAEAYRFGHLAETMSSLRNKNDAMAIGYHHWAIHYWRKSVRSSLPALTAVSKSAINSNDMEHLSLFVGAYFANVLVSGAPLHQGDAMFQSFQTHRAAFGARDSWLATLPFQLVLKLRGRYDDPIDITGLSGVQNDDSAQTRGIQYAMFFRLIAAVFFQDHGTAMKLKDKLFIRPSGVLLPYQAFMEGLISTNNIRSTSSNKEKISHQRKAAKIIDVLKSWGKKGMREAAHMTNILNTELHVGIKRDLTPDRISALYDTAIGAAAKQGFFHHQALASERAALHLLSINEPVLARKHMSQAYQLYQRWGAHGKVENLEFQYPDYIAPPPKPEGEEEPFAGSVEPAPQTPPVRAPAGRGGRGRFPGRGRGRRAPGRGRGPRGWRGPPPQRGGRAPPNRAPPNRAPLPAGRSARVVRGGPPPPTRGPVRGGRAPTPARAPGNRLPPPPVRPLSNRAPPPVRRGGPRSGPSRGQPGRGGDGGRGPPSFISTASPSEDSTAATQTDTTASDDTPGAAEGTKKEKKKKNAVLKALSFGKKSSSKSEKS